MILNEMSVEELKVLREEVSAELKSRRNEVLEANREAKAEREARFKGNVAEGSTIRFLFNREEREAEVVRVSEKSVTVEVDGKKKYIKYSNILDVTAEAEATEKVA